MPKYGSNNPRVTTPRISTTWNYNPTHISKRIHVLTFMYTGLWKYNNIGAVADSGGTAPLYIKQKWAKLLVCASMILLPWSVIPIWRSQSGKILPLSSETFLGPPLHKILYPNFDILPLWQDCGRFKWKWFQLSILYLQTVYSEETTSWFNNDLSL